MFPTKTGCEFNGIKMIITEKRFSESFSKSFLHSQSSEDVLVKYLF